MKKTPYLYQRGGQWWYRRRVPPQLVPLIGKAEFDESLNTSDRDAAKGRVAIRNAEVAVQFQTALAQLKAQQAHQDPSTTPSTPQAMTPELLQYARDAVRAHVLKEDERVRRERPDLDSLDAYESIRADQFEEAGNALRTGRTERLQIDEALQAIGVSVPSRHPARDEVVYAATEGHHSALLAIRERMNGEYVPTPAPPAKPSALGTVEPAQGVLLLGTVIDDYIANLKQTEFTRKVKRCLQLFGEVIGRDTPVRELKQRLITDFLRTICKLPLEWAKQYDKGVPVATLLAKGTDKAMSPTTYVDNYRAPLGTFLAASLRDHGDDGFPARTVDGIEYSGDRMADEEKQRALSPDELRTLYEGEQFAAIAKDPEQEALYWFSTVLLFTGARPRELCQTNPLVDFGQELGHWFMDISETTAAGKGVTKSVKTGEGRRVPLHPELVRLGFPEYVLRIKEAGADRLFPSFRIKAGNTYTANGDLFSDLLKATSLYTRKAPPGKLVTGAYVLRKTFITQCSHQGVVSKELTGHSDGKTTAIQDKHYITEPELFAKKLGELQKLVLPVQIPLRG